MNAFYPFKNKSRVARKKRSPPREIYCEKGKNRLVNTLAKYVIPLGVSAEVHLTLTANAPFDYVLHLKFSSLVKVLHFDEYPVLEFC